DVAIGAERRNRETGLGVQRYKLVTGSDEQDAVVASAVAPIGDSAIVSSDRAALGRIVAAIGPQGLARGGVGGDNRASGTGGEIQLACYHQWSYFPGSLGRRSHVLRLPAPGDLQSFDVRGVDLIEWRIARAAGIASIDAPFARRCR